MKVSLDIRGFVALSVAFSSIILQVTAAPAPAAISKKLANFTEVFSGGFRVSRTSVTWLESDKKDEDGLYVSQDATGSLIFKNIVTGKNETFVNAADVGVDQSDVVDYQIQPDRKYVLYATNYTKQYRYTYFADYHVFNRETKETVPLVADQVGDIQYAGWAPKGDVIAFVRGNDLYIWRNGKVSRVTTDGGPDLFNAVPDWVYEEEIFGDTKTLWFSPDAKYLAYLSFNETGVPTYTIPYYMAHQKTAPPYPEELELRYPKVGEKNPTVSFSLLSLKDEDAKPEKIELDTFEADDLLVTEVAWVAEEHSNVIVRTTNRYQDLEKLLLVDVEKASAKVVRERDATDGWLEPLQAIKFIPGLDNPSYIDLSDESGWNHIYLHTVDGSKKPVALTSGNWEVSSIVKVDASRGLIYYLSTERHSTERHLFSVTFDGKKKALVDTKKEGVYAASFSTGGGYYILSYNGPGLPWQKLHSVDSANALQTLNDNAVLKAKLANYNLPTQSWSTVKNPEGFTFNVVEYLPPGFNPNKKYPVLFAPYGGPNAQETTKTFRTTVDWKNYVASDPELQYIIVVVDGRGTGYQGRKHRAAVTKQLGKLEAEDQLFVAKEWRKKRYVDSNHIAIWGWSFGGYLSGKVAELNSGVFTLAIMTAPVTDWRFYDSMYTERYMKSLEANKAGYIETSINKSEGFKNIKGGFLIQHGTGDDNVHFQNTAVLVDKFLQEGVKPHRMQSTFFPDSDHSINFHGATDYLYRELASELYEEKMRKGDGTRGHQWEL